MKILNRLTDSRYSEVLPLWKDQTAILIAGGPSLTHEQVMQVYNAHHGGKVKCVAVNDAYLLAPFADAHYAADAHWHKWHSEGIDRAGFSAIQVKTRWQQFKGQKCSIQNSADNIVDQQVHILRNRDFPNHGNGLSLDPQSLVTGRNSGFQALNLAVLAGAKRIVLLGYDGKPDEARNHWFGDHPRPTPAAIWPLLLQAMSAAENALIDAGVEVINCSPGTAINSFPKMDIAEALC